MMILHDFIHQIMRSTGEADSGKFSIQTTLQYINEEIDYVSREFPEKASFILPITSAGFYHTIDLTDHPVVRVNNLMVDGVGADKQRWKILKGRIGNAI